MLFPDFLKMVTLTKEFSLAMEQPVNVGLDMPTDLLELRLKLIKEETKEFINAILFEPKENILKEGCDLLYVLAGGIATVGVTNLDFNFDYKNTFENLFNPNLPYTHIEDLTAYCKLIETQGDLAAQVVKLHNDRNTRKWYFNYHVPYFMYLVFDLLTNYFFFGYFGLMDSAFEEVHASNMTKLGDDGKPIYREDGKVIKGPNYRKPDMSKFLTMFNEDVRATATDFNALNKIVADMKETNQNV